MSLIGQGSDGGVIGAKQSECGAEKRTLSMMMIKGRCATNKRHSGASSN